MRFKGKWQGLHLRMTINWTFAELRPFFLQGNLLLDEYHNFATRTMAWNSAIGKSECQFLLCLESKLESNINCGILQRTNERFIEVFNLHCYRGRHSTGSPK